MIDGEIQELKTLWQAGRLGKVDEWRRYELVFKALRELSAQQKISVLLQQLKHERDDYIGDYYLSRIFQSGQSEPLHHIGALGFYFRRYLLDCLKREGREIPDDEPPEVPSEGCVTDAFAQLVERSGQTEQQIRGSARAFIATLPGWAHLYLRFYQCADEHQKIRLSGLAERYQIASYHYKAQQLGISPERKHPDPTAYQDTLLGQWLLSIRVLPLEADDTEGRAAFQAALAIFCQEILWDGTGEPD